MAANIIGRYVWLVDTLRRYKRLTFKEINELWQESGLGYGDVFPKRTFHNHQKAIVDLFDVYIECDRKDGYRYYLDEPERLEGNIQELINFDFSSLRGDSRYGCNGRSFDCDDTNLMRGISFLLWGGSFPDLTLYEIGPGKKYRGDTLNTFNRVFGKFVAEQTHGEG